MESKKPEYIKIIGHTVVALFVLAVWFLLITQIGINLMALIK